MTPSVGDKCTQNHDGHGHCVWDGVKWTRTDELRPCPFDQSN